MGSTSSRRSNNRPHQPSGLAIGYARVSTTEQAEEGISLGAQVASIQRYAAVHDLCLDPPRGIVASGDKLLSIYPPLGVFIDGGISGKTPLIARPQGAKLAALIRGRFVSHLIVTKQDRFSRSALDISLWRGELIEYSVTLHLIDEGGRVGSGPSDRLMMGIRGELAQWQREVIGASTQTAIDYKRDKGEKLGGPVPYGQSVYLDAAGVKCLKPHPGEQATIQRARELREDGLSFPAVGRQLFDEGMKPRTGGPWHPQQIANMMEKQG